MELIVMQLAPIVFTLLALWQMRSLAGRRSAMREGLATSGAVIIISGLLCKTILVSSSTGNYLSYSLAYPILGAGFILLMYGFVGWDRMTLHRPGWVKPISAIVIVEASIATLAYIGSPWWRYLAVGVVVACVLLMDLLLLGYALRQRFYIAIPFLVLHMAASCITSMIDLNGQSDARIIQGIVLTATTSALLFYINTRLINHHTYRGRMQIV
ncbi:MAG: hypothetical protein DWI30_06880 [Chloroflexi bacterium]|nr:MAG: hypothetical protein DWI30_06880 [Chloroflexota bacterium]